ncbi:MAG TPA: carboxypeptidase-like regulatory domain-containing protein [Acidobacteriaceae bacterium]|nr:carboxypeptidase-like regulatory domain-containing protein [Acidobacteriaceae bacterium]
MRRAVAGLVLTVLVLGWSGHCKAASTDAAISGVVRDSHGTPQMGALIELLKADATMVASALTDDHGRYIIPAVLPGKYQLRASAAFLVPVTRGDLRLQAGAQAVINLTMTTLYEAANWLPTQGRRAGEPVDDWKWTLRSTASRPLLRLTDENGQEMSSSGVEGRRVVSQGRVEVTNGDGAFGQGGVHQILMINRTLEDGDSAVMRADIADLGSMVSPRFSADVSAGYEKRSQFGSTRLVAAMQTHPELTAAGGNAGYGVLRMASAHQMSMGDAVMIDAGTLVAAERLASTMIDAEPYLRVSVRPGDDLLVVYRYASGRELQSADDLDRLKPENPLLADAQGRPLTGRGMHHEVSVSKKMGSRVMTASGYVDRVNEDSIGGSGVLDMKAEQGMALVADPVTGTFQLATGSFAGRGMSVNLEQSLTPLLKASVQYDLGTAIGRERDLVALAQAAAELHAQTEQAITVMLNGKVVRSGTNVRAEYRWQPQETLTQVNAYNADPNGAYLTFYVRQRLACGRFLPNGMDAVVEATNLLEQGYQPVLAPDGHTLFLAQVPRSIQAGLAFNF